MNTSVKTLPGVGPARVKLLSKMGIETLSDLLNLYPRRYEDRSMVVPIDEAMGHLGEPISIVAKVVGVPEERRIRGGRVLSRFTVEDETGLMTLTYFNNPYIKDKLKEGKTFNFYGRCDTKMLLNMIAPQAEELKEGQKPGIEPIYPLTAGLSQKQLRWWMRMAFDRAKGWSDPLPQKLQEKYQLLDRRAALEAIHFPKDYASVAAGRRRLIFEELLYFQLGINLFSRREKDLNHFPIGRADGAFRALQPFSPTTSQQKAVEEILADMGGAYAMNRLLQGDVGSGKTYVAGEAAYAALAAGYQVAIMAPTEILARQHAEYFRPLFEELGYSVGLLVGSMTAAEKKKTYATLQSGELRLVIGTHALLQQKVQFEKLGLVIADEQHRFGVRQRAVLAAKGEKPHVLVMSATPIPRTMALMVWGDLELSVLDTLPAGRKPIQSYLVDSSYRERLQGFMDKQIAEGGQIYIVCPLVEENPEADLESAEALFEALKEQYGDAADMIHGKMRPAKKDEAMAKFVAGDTKLLVSTTVIEVGINVPNATLMVLMNAERFGLSQLHQLRGRVGRGEKQAYCILVSDHKNAKTRERLEYFCSTNDGFAISEKDLQLRGPGDFLGDMQHGMPKMQIAGLATDMELLTLSNRCAKRLLQFDPALEADYNRGIRARVFDLFDDQSIIFN